MKRALRLARRGEGWVSPNPLVGAVIVKGDLVIGQGYHRRYGGPHAELEA
ncbi:MAG: bifunctional diaminohydroxyphosphoribosylaminopyrimidine deaminase/5-amino-6-(5-phosphoribosylamino)uracil reductase, partial [Syntrophales bacterium]